MTRQEAVKMILKKLDPHDLLIVSTGYLCRDVYAFSDRPENFYMMGSMGNAYGIGMGLAMNTKKHVSVISGDGAALMNLGSLALGNYLKLLNLTHYIVNNQCYASTGGQLTCATAIDFSQFYRTIHIKVDRDEPPAPRITLSPEAITKRFIEEVKK